MNKIQVRIDKRAYLLEVSDETLARMTHYCIKNAILPGDFFRQICSMYEKLNDKVISEHLWENDY